MESESKKRKNNTCYLYNKKERMIYGSIKGHQLLHAYMLHHHFVYHLERNEVHIKEDFRSFFTLMRK